MSRVPDTTHGYRKIESTMFQTTLDTPVGTLLIEGTRDFITSIQYATKPAAAGKSCTLLNHARKQLSEYFAGRRKVFDVPINLSMGTAFQRAVWVEVMQVGYGETITYAELARHVGRPTAQRAVGRAIACNPLMIVVPSHRVLRVKGKLAGYHGGLKAKTWLLQHEHAVLM
jgi:methylated-DNA-[protein]-cysteine S-methyltransferase